MGCRQLQFNNYFSFVETEVNPQNGFRFVGNDRAESVSPVRQNKFKFIEEEFTGKQFDPNLQMQYLRARYYDQSNGRFNRLNPFAGNNNDPQSLHKYAYTHCNPVMGIDPSGKFTLLELIGVLTITTILLTFISIAVYKSIRLNALFGN